MAFDAAELKRKTVRSIAAFSPRSFIAGEQLRRQSSKQALVQFAAGRRQCVCVGTGPSLDCVDLSQVRNSTVLLLNGAFHRMEDFRGNNNQLFWFAQDVKVISEMIANVPESLTKIFTANKFSAIESFYPQFRTGRDVFLQPRPTLRDPASADPDRESLLSIWPGLFTDLDPRTYRWDPRRRFHVALRSVAFSAIFLALHFDFERVIALGMDLPDGRKPHTHASGCGPSLQGRGFGTEARDRALNQLVDMARHRGIRLINASPLSEVEILPKRASIESALLAT
jgi:hypothetical protein